MKEDKQTQAQVGQFHFYRIGQQLWYAQPSQWRAQTHARAALCICMKNLVDGCALQAWCSLKCTCVNVHASNALLFVALHANADGLSSADLTSWFRLSQCPLTVSQHGCKRRQTEPNCCHLVVFIFFTEKEQEGIDSFQWGRWVDFDWG